MKFVSLHHHTTFSFMDGYGTPEQHAERAAELGMSALAVTEHGNVSSHVQHEKACARNGIKPLFGMEAYMHPESDSRRKFHLTLLAMDQEGYANLMRICSRSWAEGFYQWPTVSGQILADHAEGIIVLSGCSDSLLACSLLGGKTIEPADSGWSRALSVARGFQRVFGDRFYLECQMFPELERTCQINPAYERMGRELGIGLVATADVHYPMPDDNTMQLTLHAAGRGAADVAKQAEGWEYDIRLTFPTSDQMVMDRLAGTGLSHGAAQEAARNTARIAARCTVTLPKAARFRYPGMKGVDAVETLWAWLREGWAYRVEQGFTPGARTGVYRDQVQMEMKIIVDQDYVDYFLLVSDLVRFAKEAGIAVGPGRGSSAASVVCWLLRITEVDPMIYPLMDFSRFIVPGREDLPDIDIDFDDERRHEVRDYAARKYGADRVGTIGTFTQYKGKNSIDDVARVHRIPKFVAEDLKSLVVERSAGDSRAAFALADTFAMFPAAQMILDDWPALGLAVRLEGNYRGMSTHPAGLVITNSPVADTCALYTRRNAAGEESTAVSVDKKDAEYLGLMKVDLLGLTTMGMIRIVLEAAGLTVEDLYRIPVSDPETLAAFQRNDVVGIFQFEGRATRFVNQKVVPDNFLELVDVIALSRPGPLFSGTAVEYVEVKHGVREKTSIHPVLDEITKLTKGQIIYQEQILRALRLFGGLDAKRVHDIRKIISQKLGEAQFNASFEAFAEGAARLHGASGEVAADVWSRVVTSASYAFVYGHSLSYALIGYWAMWLKVNHPDNFYVAQLRKSHKDKYPRLIKDAERHGITVRGVTLGLSGRDWQPARRQDAADVDGGIVAGWTQMEGVGPVVAERIVDQEGALIAATGRGFEHPEDLLQVSGIGEKTLEKMLPLLTTDDPFGLRVAERRLAGVIREIESGKIPLPRPTHTSETIATADPSATIYWLGLVKSKEYKDFIDDERARSGETAEQIRARIPQPDLTVSCFMHCYDADDEEVYVRATRQKFPGWKRMIAGIRLNHDVIFVQGRKGKGVFGANLYVNRLWVIDPD